MFRFLRLNKMGAKRNAPSFPLALLTTCLLYNPTQATTVLELNEHISLEELVDRGAILKRRLSSNELSSKLFILKIDLRNLKGCSVKGVFMRIEADDDKTLFAGDLAPSFGTFNVTFDERFLPKINLNIDCSQDEWLGPFLWVDFSSIDKDLILIEMQKIRETEVEQLGGSKSILIENIGEPMIIDSDTFDKMRREQPR